MAAAVAIGPNSRPSVSSSTARCAPRVSTDVVPPRRSVICTASSTAHSSCGLIENPDARVSTSCPSGVTAILPPTVGTRLTQTSISMTRLLATDPLVGRVEQRGGAGPRDRHRVLLAHVLHQQRVALDGLLGGQVGHQQGLE